MEFDKVKKEHILQGIRDYRDKGNPKGLSNSKHYDVEIEGQLYSPKPVMAYANFYASGKTPGNYFSGGKGTPCFDAFERIGYRILSKKNNSNQEDLRAKESTNVWIEKTKVRGREDRKIGERAFSKVIWSPTTGSDGRDTYKNMRLINKGDFILHFIDNNKFAGISIVSDDIENVSGLENTQWDKDCYIRHESLVGGICTGHASQDMPKNGWE